MTRQAIGAVETGRAQPGVVLALAIARALGLSVERLFGEVRDDELQIEGAEVLHPGQRVVVGEIAHRRVVRALDGAASAAWIADSAQGIVTGVSGSAATVRFLQGLPDERTVLVSGCDLALGLLVRHLEGGRAHGVWFSTSNQRALADLAAHRSHVAAVHGTPEELTRAFSRHNPLGRHRRLRRFELAATEAGWLVAKDNPLGLHGACDLARTHARLVNRPPGSGARALLDAELRRAAIEPGRVRGYARQLAGPLDVARAIVQDFADAAIGSAAAAAACGLDFIPLRRESCVLLVSESSCAHPGVTELLETLRTPSYRRDLEALGPYDARRIGEEVRVRS